MKKRNVFLFLLLPIFLIGIAFIIAGVTLGGTLYSYELKTDGKDTNYQTDTLELSAADAESIQGIDWNLRTSKVHLVNGEHYGISSTGKYHSYVKDGIWHIETQKRVARITFLSHSIEIPSFWNPDWDENDDLSYTITLPTEKELQSASLKIAAGEFTGETLSADKVTIKTGAGSAQLKQLTAKDLSVKVGAGTTEIDTLQISDSCNAKVGAGELILGQKSALSGINLMNNLNGKCAAGDMTVTGKLTGNSYLACATGSMELSLDGISNNYSLSKDKVMGDIEIKDEYSSTSQTASNENEHFGNLDLKCSLGEIDITFRN